MSPFICEECKQVVRSPYNRYTERVEYLRVGGGHRLRSVTLRELCRGCADQAAETLRARRDGAALSNVEQRRML